MFNFLLYQISNNILSLNELFCNCFFGKNNFAVVNAEPLGDRGGSHLPDIGIQISFSTELIVALIAITALCVSAIILICIIKHKNFVDATNKNNKPVETEQKNINKNEVEKELQKLKEDSAK